MRRNRKSFVTERAPGSPMMVAGGAGGVGEGLLAALRAGGHHPLLAQAHLERLTCRQQLTARSTEENVSSTVCRPRA